MSTKVTAKPNWHTAAVRRLVERAPHALNYILATIRQQVEFMLAAERLLPESRTKLIELEKEVNNAVDWARCLPTSARRILDSQLPQAQEMNELTMFGGNLTVDFGCRASPIACFADWMLEDERLEPELRASLLKVHREVYRIEDLRLQLRHVLGFKYREPQVLNLAALLDAQLTILRRLVGENIHLELEVNVNPLWLPADRGMIERVVMNLVVNARDATPKGGRICLSACRVEINPSQEAEARPGQFICLAVADTGCGMDDPTLKRIFEPFFTTKEIGLGNGLGLNIVNDLVGEHQGWLEVDSAEGKGSTFRVYLPACPASESKPDAS